MIIIYVRTQKNHTLVAWRKAPSGYDSFDFVDMLENASHEFSANLDVKSGVHSNDTAFNASNKYLLAIGSAAIDDLIDDDDSGGDVNITYCVIIKPE